MMRLVVCAACVLFFGWAFSSCAASSQSPASPTAAAISEVQEPPAEITQTRAAPVRYEIFAGAGDIADCQTGGAALTVQLLNHIPGEIFTLGDNAYPSTTAQTLADCYEPTWGRDRARTHPAPGNHDWSPSSGAAPYFAYFGAAAGPAGRGYYSFDLGAWHILSLNSNVNAKPGSPQYQWVHDDLEHAKSACALVYWHHPLFSSGPYGNLPQMRDIWRMLEDAHVDIVMTGHEHSYERFAPQDADGRRDAYGIREFVVGTGGTALRPFRSVVPNSEVRDAITWGVLKLTLRESSYDWEFVPVEGGVFRDAGTAECMDD